MSERITSFHTGAKELPHIFKTSWSQELMPHVKRESSSDFTRLFFLLLLVQQCGDNSPNGKLH